MSPRLRVFLFVAAVTAVSATQMAWGQLKSPPGDWPGWRGPDRIGLSAETGLLKEWPKGGPTLLWKATGLGGGYSTPSIAGGRLYAMGTRPQQATGGKAGGGKGKGKAKGSSGPEFVFCLDLKDGKKVWSAEVGATRGGYPAPRSTPTVDGDRVYALSSNGVLVCLGTARGELIWKKNLPADFGGQHGSWAYAESVLIDGDRLICTPGGGQATLVCLDKKTGKEEWRSSVTGLKSKAGSGGRPPRPFNQAGYTSAVVAEIAGVKQYVQFLAGGVVGVAAKDGKPLWHYPWSSDSNANAITPLVRDDSVMVASGYGVGAGRARITKDDAGKFKAEEVFFVRGLQAHHGGLLLVGDHVYGTGAQALVCVSFKNGAVAWQARGVGKGSVAYADGHLYHRGERGDVALVEATPTGYKEKGRFTQPHRSDHAAWPHPVIADGKLYLRDWDIVLCYDVKAK
jgi:outer membrane protein assembly factor BamB